MAELLAEFWRRLTTEVAQSSPLDVLIKLVAVVVLLAILWLSKWLLEKLWKLFSPIHSRLH